MNILLEIVHHKRAHIEHSKTITPIALLEQAEGFDRKPLSLVKRLSRNDDFGIIAEFKRRSPSKGNINNRALPGQIARDYEQAGAAGISILTDEKFFGGNLEDLSAARDSVHIPLLRKDFIIDEYQLFESKAHGADVILLIAECLSKSQLHLLAKKARELQLEVLMEVHSKEQLEKLSPFVDIVGVNNRNLENFAVDIQTSIQLYEQIPEDIAKISESGIDDLRSIELLHNRGFNGFLIGERFMKCSDPGAECKKFCKSGKIVS